MVYLLVFVVAARGRPLKLERDRFSGSAWSYVVLLKGTDQAM